MKTAGLVVALALACVACGPPDVRPVSFPDSAVACPAGLLSWDLQIQDQRAEPEGAAKMIAAIRNGVEKSFPGCHWSSGGEGATITIVVHSFASVKGNGYQDASAEWTVTARSAGGSTITEFDAAEQDSRPAYPGSEEETLNEAFRKAMERTAKGLAQVPRVGSGRLPPETESAQRAGACATTREPANPLRVRPLAGSATAGAAECADWNGTRTRTRPETA